MVLTASSLDLHYDIPQQYHNADFQMIPFTRYVSWLYIDFSY